MTRLSDSDRDGGAVLTGIRAILAGRRLPGLDGLRAVAVGMVMLSHFGAGVPGDLGVSIFFVLSGFLITWLLLREYRATADLSLRRFYIRRTLRIFPAYYAFLAFSITIDLVRGDSRIRPLILPALAYLVNYYNAFHGHPITSVAHAWSLAVEEQFYLLWPLCFLFFARRGRPALVVGLGLLIGAVLVWRCVAYFVLDLGSAYVYNAFDTRFDNLAVGCLLAVLSERDWFAAVAARLATSPILTLVPIALLFVSRILAPTAWHYGPGFTVDAVLIALWITQVLQLQHSLWWSWLEHPVTRYLGTISYPLYLYHLWGFGLGVRAAPDAPRAIQFVLGTLASIVLASGSYYVVERPFLRLKGRFEELPSGTAPSPGRNNG